MFLSKLTLNPQHPQARRDLADAYEMHRTLARAFVADASTPPRRFLWRLERSVHANPSSILLVQSEWLADWNYLESMSGYAGKIHGNKPVNLEKLVEIGARYRFRLLANPTITRNGKRYGWRKKLINMLGLLVKAKSTVFPWARTCGWRMNVSRHVKEAKATELSCIQCCSKD